MEVSAIVQFSFTKKKEREREVSDFPFEISSIMIIDHGLTHLYIVFQKRAREGEEKEREIRVYLSEGKERKKSLYNFFFIHLIFFLLLFPPFSSK
jgi:hypothetical protein